jgi:hypothetical protein
LSTTKVHRRWVDREIATAATRASRDRSVRLIPVLLDRRAEIPPLLSRYQYIRSNDTRDVERAADLILNSLSSVVSVPNFDLERRVLEAERANLDEEVARGVGGTSRPFSGLIRVVSIVGLVAGFAATTLVAWVSTRHGIAPVALTLVSLMSAALSTTVAFYYRRSHDGH